MYVCTCMFCLAESKKKGIILELDSVKHFESQTIENSFFYTESKYCHNRTVKKDVKVLNAPCSPSPSSQTLLFSQTLHALPPHPARLYYLVKRSMLSLPPHPARFYCLVKHFMLIQTRLCYLVMDIITSLHLQVNNSFSLSGYHSYICRLFQMCRLYHIMFKVHS